jgi:hypothetical protein
MPARLVAKTVARFASGIALFVTLSAATCEGDATVFVRSLEQPGSCTVLYPPDRPPIHDGDVMQIADANNVNDFIQCHAVDTGVSLFTDRPISISVSPSDAQGHSWVAHRADGPPNASVVNLSR